MRHTPRGTRGGRDSPRNRDIHSKVRGVRTIGRGAESPTAAIGERGKYFGIADIAETKETHVVPRKSLTVKQLLAVKQPDIETEPVASRQLDKRDSDKFTSVQEALYQGRMVKTTDERMTWRADRSLLIRGTPGSTLPVVKRDGYVKQGLNKRNTRVTEREMPATDLDPKVLPVVGLINTDDNAE